MCNLRQGFGLDFDVAVPESDKATTCGHHALTQVLTVVVAHLRSDSTDSEAQI